MNEDVVPVILRGYCGVDFTVTLDVDRLREMFDAGCPPEAIGLSLEAGLAAQTILCPACSEARLN
jgi:hypothetical protein